MTAKVRMTADDLWRLGAGDVKRELVDGEVVEMAPVGGIHGDVTGRIYRKVAEYADAHPSGKALVGDVGFILNLPRDPERVRTPDVAFISTARLPGGQLPARFIVGAPDLAVEVLSPSDDPVDVQQKVRDYLDAGAQLVWVIAAQARTATVYRANGSARLLRDHDSLEGEQVLPGLTVRLADVFD